LTLAKPGHREKKQECDGGLFDETHANGAQAGVPHGRRSS
jgi:hypothetical protein